MPRDPIFGIVGIGVMVMGYFGYYLALENWKGNELQQQAPWGFFVKWGTICQFVIGIIFVFALFQQMKIDKMYGEPHALSFFRAADYEKASREYAEKIKIRNALRWVAGIILLVPFLFNLITSRMK